MRMLSLVLLLSACGVEDRTPIVSPCQAGYLALLSELKLSCGSGPLDPATRDPRWWSDSLPCSLTVESLEGDQWVVQSEKDYDYSAAYQHPNATYDAAGNITSVIFPEQFPGRDPAVLSYEYRGGLIARASVGTSGFGYTYDGDRLLEERPEAAGATTLLRYAYDGANLVAVRAIFEDTAFDMLTYEYQNGLLVAEESRVRGRAKNPRWVYTRDSQDRITVAELDPGDATSLFAERRTYAYTCHGSSVGI